MKGDICILDENKICNDCGDCDYCDLDADKICDNCGKCIETTEKFAKIKIDEIKLDKEN